MSNRFDYAVFDKFTMERQEAAKRIVENLEKFINEFAYYRNGINAMRSLEETYMWVSKAIQDERMIREGK